jgi:leader peptidase (prepilin peptidase)/N-methyltransferase
MFWLFIFGAIFGSFLGCMGYRIPNKIKTTYPSSFCASCNKTLKWYMNIPIISYIRQGGKCAYCHKKIGFIYFLCEILCACLFVLSYYLFKFDINFFLSIILTCALIVTIVSDFKYYYISDRVLIISEILIIITLLVFKEPYDALMNVVSGLIVFLVMIGLKILGNGMFGRESLGDGDIKLMGVIGTALGLIYSFVTLFFASVIALIFSLINMKKHPDGVIPYGPFLLIGALIVIYFSSILYPYLDKLLSL